MYRSLKVIVNSKSSDAEAVKAGIPHGLLLVSNLFLHYKSGGLKHILPWFVNIYADYTRVYGYALKSLNDQRLTADLFDLALTFL